MKTMEELLKEKEKKHQKLYELNLNITSVKKSLDGVEREIKQLEENINKFKIQLNDKEEYYYIDEEFKVDTYCYNSDYDNRMVENYNAFQSKEDAEKMAKYWRIFTKAIFVMNKINGDWKPDWKNEKQIKYNITFQQFLRSGGYYEQSFNPFVFETDKKRQEFEDVMGKDDVRFLILFQ